MHSHKILYNNLTFVESSQMHNIDAIIQLANWFFHQMFDIIHFADWLNNFDLILTIQLK